MRIAVTSLNRSIQRQCVRVPFAMAASSYRRSASQPTPLLPSRLSHLSIRNGNVSSSICSKTLRQPRPLSWCMSSPPHSSSSVRSLPYVLVFLLLTFHPSHPRTLFCMFRYAKQFQHSMSARACGSASSLALVQEESSLILEV